jgi:hypothetical protein
MTAISTQTEYQGKHEAPVSTRNHAHDAGTMEGTLKSLLASLRSDRELARRYGFPLSDRTPEYIAEIEHVLAKVGAVE